VQAPADPVSHQRLHDGEPVRPGRASRPRCRSPRAAGPALISPIRAPGSRGSRRSRRAAFVVTRPTGSVSALSACQPSWIRPMSMPTMSPSMQDPVARDAVHDFLVHRDAGRRRKAVVPLEGGGYSRFRGSGFDAASSRRSSTPGAHQLAHPRKTEARNRRRPAILSTSAGDFSRICNAPRAKDLTQRTARSSPPPVRNRAHAVDPWQRVTRLEDALPPAGSSRGRRSDGAGSVSSSSSLW
jgi:hypothetical protein